MGGDPIAELAEILRAVGAKPTYDRHRSISLACCLCETTDKPRTLVDIGTYTRMMGGGLGPGDRITRPMCDGCRILTEPAPTMMTSDESVEMKRLCARFHNAANDEAEQLALRAFARAIPRDAVPTLFALVEDGPLPDEKIPSKEARGHLVLWGLAMRVLVKGEPRWTAVVPDAAPLLEAVRSYAPEKWPS